MTRIQGGAIERIYEAIVVYSGGWCDEESLRRGDEILSIAAGMLEKYNSLGAMRQCQAVQWMVGRWVEYCGGKERYMGLYLGNLNRLLVSLYLDGGDSKIFVQAVVKLIAVAWIATERYDVGLGVETFVNETISSLLDIREEFPKWKSKGESFSFCNFPFILSTTFKCDLLKIESLVQMRHELQDAFFRGMFGGLQMPYLVIEVRREHIIRDAMIQLDRIKTQDLKKQLRIQFVQEEGVDEGGLQKEFFQLAIREILHPKYGMFILNEETENYWFHPSQYSGSGDPDLVAMHEYRLIGKLIGLAIYNNIILDLRFPNVIFKRLLGVKVGLEDLGEVDPILYKGLKRLLDMDEDEDIENIYQRMFVIDQCYLGHHLVHELVPGGRNIPLTAKNRGEYVALLVEYYLYSSINLAMMALEEGFREVCIDTALHLFHPEEFEALVCGRSLLDMASLKACTSYDGGYHQSSGIVTFFWDIVLGEMTMEDQRQLLFFVTGSIRMPVGGPHRLHFVIMRQGSDSELLPTAHTCYNILLLPEYSSKEKLRTKLKIALQNAEGFGMI